MAKGGNIGKNGGASYNFPREQMVAAAAGGAGDGTLRILVEIQDQIRAQLSKRGTGIRYAGQPTRSSAPGQPPAAQTSSLRNSWQTGSRKQIRDGKRLGWQVGSALPYARLEFGFGRALPRPYIRPAIEKVRPRMQRIMNAYISAAIRKAFPRTKP